MNNTLLIKNGRLINPENRVDEKLDILIEGTHIKEIAATGSFDAIDNKQIIDAEGKWILPGLIDLHVHLREPGQEYKEDLESGLKCASAGGFTAVVSMPNTSPAIDNGFLVESLIAKAKKIALTKLYPSAAMTRGRKGLELTEFAELKEAGAIAVTDDGSWVKDPQVMRRVLDYAAVHDLIPMSHAEDHSLSGGGCMHEGVVSTRLGLKGISSQSENNAVARDINLVELTGKPLHICHVSTKGAVELIRKAKKDGLPVTAETAPHYLFLTHEIAENYNTNAKMNPPLRQDEDMQALREAIIDGTMDAIATDHAPHSVLDKETDFQSAAFGIIGLESSLSLMLELVHNKVISPMKLAELMSYNPANILKIKSGRISKNYPADLTIVDPNFEFIFDKKDSFSKSNNSPFWGRKFKGKNFITIVDGRIVYQDKNQ